MREDPRALVLVVDDDPDQLFLAQRRMEKLGFEVITAANGVEALLGLAEHPGCRRIVTDFTMPVLGGDAWIRVLERFCSGFRVVVVSGDDPDSGPFPWMPKPPDFENIATYLRSEED